MEIISLKTFKAVVDEDGIKGASLALNTVASNISTRIQKLEHELDVELFQLQGRKLELTPAGRLLYHHAAEILQMEYRATMAIHENRGAYDLRIGSPDTFAAVHLPLALKALRLSNREIRPKIHTGTSGELMNAVLQNKVDCAFAGDRPPHEDIESIPVVQEDLVLVEPTDRRYDPVLFVREEGCAYRDFAIAQRDQQGRSHEEIMVLSSIDGVLGCVAAGLGYTVIGRDLVENNRYENAVIMQEANKDQTRITISLIFRKDNPLMAGIQQLAGKFQQLENHHNLLASATDRPQTKPV